MDWQTAKDLPLGHPWSKADLKKHFQALCGGVAWPGERPGFAVIVGLGREKHFDSYDTYLLDEYEAVDTRELVRQLGVLDSRYEPVRWIGDPRNDAADRFLQELNAERRNAASGSGPTFPGRSPRPRYVVPIHSPLLDMKKPYRYILPDLKRLLDADRRQLFLKTSRVKDYLTGIRPDDVPTLEFGAYPAIEALALVVTAVRQEAGRSDEDEVDEMSAAMSYTVPEMD